MSEEITITGDAVSDHLTMSRVDFIRLREADRAFAAAAEREAILGFCERMCEAHRIVGYVVSPILKEVMKYIRERGSK
jgi:hypothetical protein